jgi:hypothetical protein
MTIDLNTVINAASFALIAWTLKTVHNMSKTQAATEEKDKAQDARIDENRARIISVETKVGRLEVDVGKLQS